MSKLNMVGCLATSLLLGSAAWGGSIAVSVADLGRGPANAPADLNHDIIRHDTGTGRVTIHHVDHTGLDLIESEFTLDGLELTDDQAGTEYSAGQIIFNNNGTNGSGARANYEVNGRITSLELTSGGSNHNVNTDRLPGAGPLTDSGLRMFPLVAENSNANGTNANANAFVAPYPNKDVDDHSHVTGFRIISPGSGANIDGISIPSFRLSLYPIPANDDAFGDIYLYTDSSGGISAVEHEDDTPTTPVGDKIIHNLTDVLVDTEHTEVDDSVYYFNQMNTNGLTHQHYDTHPIGVRFKADGDSVQFSSPPQIELYRGGEVVHVALHDEGSGFLSDPEFSDGSEQGGTGLSLNWQRRGPIHAITDFDPGSGYQSLPTLTLSDPHGQGSGAQVTLLHTEAFQGGPR
ncbi:MAG: hypothetical protein VX527_10210, partial [Planctomycetota bacterium]|nr:hypothetical protein [Planctomycetota bacterium]